MTALDESIEKWRLIWGAGGRDQGIYNCSLCAKYYIDDCVGCIIFKHTQKHGCRWTPYEKWEAHQLKNHTSFNHKVKIGCKECSRLAFEQYRFMRSLKD